MITRARSAVAVLVAGAMGVGGFGFGLLGGARHDVAAAPAASIAVASEAAEAPAVLPVSVPADAPGPNSGGLLTVIPPPPPPAVVQQVAPEADRGSTTSRRQASARTAPPSPGAQPPAPAPAAEPASESGYASGLASAVNSERTSRGLNALASSSCAAKYAYSWAEHLASTGDFAHQDVGRVLNGCNAMAAGENSARGTGPVSETVSAWLASSGHRANILEPGYTHTAVASVRAADGRIVSVQIFLTL